MDSVSSKKKYNEKLFIQKKIDNYNDSFVPDDTEDSDRIILYKKLKTSNDSDVSDDSNLLLSSDIVKNDEYDSFLNGSNEICASETDLTLLTLTKKIFNEYWWHTEFGDRIRKDMVKLNKTDIATQNAILNVLASFVYQERSVISVLDKLSEKVDNLDIKHLWKFQELIEHEHWKSYSLYLRGVYGNRSPGLEEFLQNKMKNDQILKKKNDWITHDENNGRTAQLLIACATEGISFTTNFGILLPLMDKFGLDTLKEIINSVIRDEWTHRNISIEIVHKLDKKVDKDLARKIFVQAVDLEIEQASIFLTPRIIGVRFDDIEESIKYFCDRLYQDLTGDSPIYYANLPIEEYKLMNLQFREKFFEKQPTYFQEPKVKLNASNIRADETNFI